MLLTSVLILNPLKKLQSFRQWEQEMVIIPKDDNSYTTQYQEAFLKYANNAYCANYMQLFISDPENILSDNLFPSAMTSGSGRFSSDPCDLSSINEEYLDLQHVAGIAPGLNNCTACILTASRSYLYSPPESPKNWGQVDHTLSDYHSDTLEMRITFWIPDITNCWRQPGKVYSKYVNLCNVPCDRFSIIPHAISLEVSYSIGQDVIG